MRRVMNDMADSVKGSGSKERRSESASSSEQTQITAVEKISAPLGESAEDDRTQQIDSAALLELQEESALGAPSRGSDDRTAEHEIPSPKPQT